MELGMNQPTRILIVDDDPQVRTFLKKRLEMNSYVCESAENGAEGLEKIKQTAFDLVMTDIKMPVMDGFEMIIQMRLNNPDLPVVIILSAYTELNQLRKAIQQGAHDYLTKPFNLHEMDITVQRALERNRLIRENLSYKKRLEEKVEQQTIALWNQLQELENTHKNLLNSYESTIIVLCAALEAKDQSTEHHVRRVENHVQSIARYMGMDEEKIRVIRWGAILHDIGKIGISDNILLKEGPLTPEEWKVMKKHPVIGYEMIKNVSFLKNVSPLVLHHHEKYDGSGYPDGLKGEAIPLEARIFSVADAFDAMTSQRLYGRIFTQESALEEIARCSGSHFDPEIAQIFINIMTKKL
jgi:putative nucleotidyltransferase with HDIG domain